MSLADDLAIATRVLARHELLGMFGHVSVLAPEAGRYLVSPGAGRRKDLCRGEDVFDLSFDDDWKPGMPLELYMHSEAHRLTPSVGALVHIHAPGLTQLSVMEQIPSDVLQLHASFWPDAVPVFEQTDLVRDRDAATHLAQLLGTQSLALMRWHGAIVVGKTLPEALYRALHAEEHARTLIASLSHAQPLTVLPASVQRDEFDAHLVNERLLDLHWRYESSFVAGPDATCGCGGDHV
ncbi:class II aldolase/adducin family protein [Conexibacter sp. CPCC 206217]|uniref:class II aldolase/adducin family protein n=1 Tax=Conexibacter sp. CPCC 206217 TaxID=3064574 RepID=UPI00271DD8A3|nr:class II aldolase/adducin family protein [Conexibacter sp. CPCC 206217]MDO8212535.1 class II aldolase/adducin family protein [Conexibacter sp. CPCC 206217]